MTPAEQKAINDISKKIDIAKTKSEITDLINELNDLGIASGSALTKTTEYIDVVNKGSLKLNGTIKETNDLFDNLFSEFKDGFNDVRESFETLTNTTTNLGSSMTLWREYYKRIREVSVEYGIAGKALDDYKLRNLEVERSLINTGLEANDLKDGIKSLFDETQNITQLSSEFGSALGNISKVMGISSAETGRLLGSFLNLNVSFKETGKILEDVRFAAEKSALNTKKVLQVFAENFEKLNTYSFKNGIKGMTDMVLLSTKLKVNMDSILNLSDSLFMDPEKTMELSTNLQLLGGSIGEMGDFNKLMYDAAVAPEELTKSIAKATSGLGVFNKESGKFELISSASRMQLKQLSTQLGISNTELMKMAEVSSKVQEIKMSVNMRPLTDEQYDTIATLSKFDNKTGQWKINVGDQSKSIATLSDEDIKRLTDVQKTTLEEQRVAKMDIGEITATKLILSQYSTADFFKAAGFDSESLRKEYINSSNKLFDGLHTQIKKGLFDPLEELGEKKVSDNVGKVLKNITLAIEEFTNKSKNFANILVSIFNNKDLKELWSEYEKRTTSRTPSEYGDILGQTNKFSEGKILDGPSHKEGGIPFSINKKTGFEAEGDEILLTKGVSRDPALLSIASKLNEMGGGKKLFKDGDIVSTTNSNYNTNNLISTMMKSEMFTNTIINSRKLDEITNTVNNVQQSSSNMMNVINDINKSQGGLNEKRSDLSIKNLRLDGNISVGGKVDISPVRISIDGTSSSKNVVMNDTLKNEILSLIENKIKNLNMYTQFTNKKGTGLPEGKYSDMIGINVL